MDITRVVPGLSIAYSGEFFQDPDDPVKFQNHDPLLTTRDQMEREHCQKLFPCVLLVRHCLKRGKESGGRKAGEGKREGKRAKEMSKKKKKVFQQIK